jgi:hypothetical protein
MNYKEIVDLSWEVSYPLEDLLPRLPSRKAHPFQLMAETLWVLSGQDRISFLQRYIPSAASFSDDGLVWPGAYGPRICAGIGAIIEILASDPETRRAYLPINYPTDLTRLKSSRDIPCNVGIQFYRSGQYLNLVRFCRSNDLIYGYAINHFEFSVLLAVVAAALPGGVIPGAYINHVTSLHVYEDKYEQVRRMMSDIPTCKSISGHSCFSFDYGNECIDTYPSLLGDHNAIWIVVETLSRAWEGTSTSQVLDTLYALRKNLSSGPSNHFVHVFYALLGAHLLFRKTNNAEVAHWWQSFKLHEEPLANNGLVAASRQFLLSKDWALSNVL